MRGVFITGLTDIEDSSLVVIIHGVGVLVQPGLIWVHRWGWSIALMRKQLIKLISEKIENDVIKYLLMDHMMGLDIIRWLDVVGVSHLVSCVMTKVNTVMQRSRDAMDSVMIGSRNGVDCVMNRSMDCMMNRSMSNMMNSMMNRGRDGMDSVNRGGGDGLIVHRGGGASVERGVN